MSKQKKHEHDVERPTDAEETRSDARIDEPEADEITSANIEMDEELGGSPDEETRLEDVSDGEVRDRPDDRPADAEEKADETLSNWITRRNAR